MAYFCVVEEENLKTLLHSYHTLAALECGGVDNWSWYGESIQDYLKEASHDFHYPVDSIEEVVEKDIVNWTK